MIVTISIVFTIIIGLIILVTYIDNYKIINPSKSIEEEYKDELKRLRIEAYNNGQYYYDRVEIGRIQMLGTRRPLFDYYLDDKTRELVEYKDKLKFNEEGLNINIDWYSDYMKNIYNLETRKKQIIINEQERIKQEKQQKIEDEEYLEKLNELRKIKPLDEDLQESFKKASRIIEIGNEINNLRKELLSLRK